MPDAVSVVFWVLSLLAVGSALLVVTTRHLVHAALWLVVTLGAVAGIFLLLAAEFVAWVQVLIYVGAVVVLLLFALMVIWLRVAYPRLREDQLQRFAWQVLVPLALLQLVVTAVGVVMTA